MEINPSRKTKKKEVKSLSNNGKGRRNVFEESYCTVAVVSQYLGTPKHHNWRVKRYR